MDLEKEYIHQGLLLVNWAQIHSQSPAAIADRGMLHFQETLQTELHDVPLVWVNPYKSVPSIIFSPMGWDLPVQSELCSYIPFCIYTYQAEWLYDNQSECVKSTKQDIGVWTKQTMQIWKPHFHKNGPVGNEARTL